MVEKVKKNKKIVSKPVSKEGVLISRVDYPITVDFGKNKIRVSPRSQMKIKDTSLLGELPSGLIVKSK